MKTTTTILLTTLALSATAIAQTNTTDPRVPTLIESGREIKGKRAVQKADWDTPEYRAVQDALAAKPVLMLSDEEVGFSTLSAMFATNAPKARRDALEARVKEISASPHPRAATAGAKYLALFSRKAEAKDMIRDLPPSDLVLRSAKQAAERLGDQMLLTNAMERATASGCSSSFYQKWFFARLGALAPADREQAIRRELRKLKDLYGDGPAIADPNAEAWVRALRVKRTLTEMEVAP